MVSQRSLAARTGTGDVYGIWRPWPTWSWPAHSQWKTLGWARLPQRRGVRRACVGGQSAPRWGVTRSRALKAAAYVIDPLAKEILQALRNGSRQNRKCPWPVAGKSLAAPVYLRRPRTQLHQRLNRTCHDTPVAGHPGYDKTFERLTREYRQPAMRKDAERFVANCHACKRIKPHRHAPHGTLLPLPGPDGPWQDISMDFVVGLPESEGYDSISVVVDRLTRQSHLAPRTAQTTAEASAGLFPGHVFGSHSSPTPLTRHLRHYLKRCSLPCRLPESINFHFPLRPVQ